MTNPRSVMVTLVFLFILFSVPGIVWAENKMNISGGSTTKIGTSFHDWYCEAEPMLKLVNNGNAAPIDGFHNGIPDLSMTIAVKDLNCDGDNKGKTSKLEENLQKALKVKTNPNIIFKMVKYVLKGDGTAAVTGNLTIASVTKEVEFNVKLTEHVNGENLQVKGETVVLMSSYGIDPITALFGTVTTKDEVKIEFEVELTPFK